MPEPSAATERWPILAPEAPPHTTARAATPTFSVVIPVHATGPGVEAAVDSVLSQAAPAAEVIVVDDGSPIDVAALLGERAEHLRLIRQPNRGVSAARNTGVERAAGEFVAFLDADDVYHPEFLMALHALTNARPDLDILTTDTRFVTGGAPGGTFYEANGFPADGQRAEILRRCFLTITSAVRRERILAVGGFDTGLTHGEDWDCWIRLILDGAAVGLVDRPLSEYRLNPGQATAQRPRSLWGRVEVLDKTLAGDRLAADERDAVRRTRHRLRRRAALTSAAEAGAGRGGRRAWLGAARAAGSDRTVWLLAGLGVLAPSAATRRALATGLVTASGPRRTTRAVDPP